MRISIEVFSMVKVVEDVFSKGFLEFHENDMLSSCLSLFKEEMPPVLAVLDSKGIKYLRGIYMALGLSIRPKTRVSKIDALKEIIRAWGLNPEEILTRDALARPQ
jgi:hypothetical protein